MPRPTDGWRPKPRRKSTWSRRRWPSTSKVFQVVDTADPIEVGGETTYQITVSNQGSKEATNIVLAVTLPDGLKPLDAEGPTRFAIAGRSVQFQPLAQLPAKGETTYRV